jgi:hypothetical protein
MHLLLLHEAKQCALLVNFGFMFKLIGKNSGTREYGMIYSGPGFLAVHPQNVRFQNVRFQNVWSKRPVFKFDIIIKQKVFVFVIFTY